MQSFIMSFVLSTVDFRWTLLSGRESWGLGRKWKGFRSADGMKAFSKLCRLWAQRNQFVWVWFHGMKLRITTQSVKVWSPLCLSCGFLQSWKHFFGIFSHIKWNPLLGKLNEWINPHVNCGPEIPPIHKIFMDLANILRPKFQCKDTLRGRINYRRGWSLGHTNCFAKWAPKTVPFQ